MNILCLLGIHKWSSCKCEICGMARKNSLSEKNNEDIKSVKENEVSKIEKNVSHHTCGSVEEWVEKVVRNPEGHFFQKVPVRDLAKACPQLFKASVSAGIIKKIGDSFNGMASAKCKCSATINGEYLAFLATALDANVVNTSNPDRVKSFFNNKCPYCSSNEWTLIWNGESMNSITQSSAGSANTRNTTHESEPTPVKTSTISNSFASDENGRNSSLLQRDSRSDLQLDTFAGTIVLKKNYFPPADTINDGEINKNILPYFLHFDFIQKYSDMDEELRVLGSVALAVRVAANLSSYPGEVVTPLEVATGYRHSVWTVRVNPTMGIRREDIVKSFVQYLQDFGFESPMFVPYDRPQRTN